MKKILLSFSLCFTVLTSASSQLESARYLGEQDIIVNQSTQAQQYRINTSLELQESAMYRLNDALVRQEALGIIVKMANLYLPSSYSCRKYFTDTPEWWVCRAAEVSADNGIVSRANTKFRPRDTLTLAESLGLLVKALNIPLSTTSTTTIQGNMPDWQKRIFLTIKEEGIMQTFSANAGGYPTHIIHIDENSGGLSMNQKITRGEFFQIVVLFLTRGQEVNPVCENYTFSNCPTGCDAVCIPSSCSGNICTADCSDAPNSCQQKPFSFVGCKTYNDGCNECSVSGGDAIACTERACVWQGIPSCSSCEVGYTLRGGRCEPSYGSCVKEGGYAGGGMVLDERPSDYVCCSGLTRAERADGTTFADAGYTCIKQGDGYCDSRYENSYNSPDCHTTACVKEGGDVGNYSLAPEYQNIGTCCSGLTSVGSKDLSVGGSNICANVGDGYCDSRYESAHNSTDCGTQTTFDSSICQSYYDGCNSCSRQSNGQTICTMMACFTNGPAYCTTYKDYLPVTQTQDDVFINKVYLEIQNYTKDISCTSSSQCDWKLFGKNPCGSSSTGIKYSSKNIDMTLFDSKTNFYTAIQTLYHQTYPTFGTCAVMTPPPPLSCINNLCQ